MKITSAIIMAGGRGSRMMPLTNVIPKAMAPFNGSTLIADGIGKLINKVNNVYITVGYKGSLLAKHVIEHNVTAIFNTEGKENCWWVFNTLLKYDNNPIFVLTCDNVVDLDFEKMAEDYFEMGAPPCMVVPVKPKEGLEGDFIFHNRGVITKLSRSETSDMYCSGIQILNPAVINSLMPPQENFYDLWMHLINQQKLMCGNIYPNNWYAVDTLSQLSNIEKISQSKNLSE